MSALSFEGYQGTERRQPAMLRSFALAAAVHLALIAVMFLGVRWQSHPAEVISVELWDPPAPQRAEPPPPPPPPRPEPKAEPEPPVKKPEIVEKAAPKPKPKPEPKKPEAKPKPRPDPAEQRRITEQLASEQRALDQERRERELKDLLSRQTKAAGEKTLATWIDRIRQKIRSNILMPPDLSGNPEAIFDVTLLPTGEVLTARLRKSSGHPGYDSAIERAILKSSPLPKPDDAAAFRRNLELKFRPQDQ